MSTTTRRRRWLQNAIKVAIVSAIFAAGPTVSAGLGPAPGPTPPITQRELLDSLSRLPGLETKYREHKFFALLAVPLVSEGTLHFAPPGRLVRHQRVPDRATVLVQGSILSFADAEGAETIDLDSQPAARLFVDSFLKLFEGDAQALAQLYATSLAANRDQDPRRWTLTLEPKDPRVAKIFTRIIVTGRETVIERFELHEVGGDRTVTTFSDTRHRRYDEREISQIFRVPW
jgi:hypothetical protein